MNIRSTILLFLWLRFAPATTGSLSEFIGTEATESQLAKIALLLYTGETIDNYTSVLIGEASKLSDKIDPEKPTVIYIHGWMETPLTNSPVVVMGAYLKRQDHNVILVNWEAVAMEALSSVSSIGLTVADGLNKLVTAGLNVTSLHVVAHSLGAQIAGYVGRNVNFTIPRITGLDPARLDSDILPEQLNSTDADFVDVIHTDVGFLGTTSTNGHVDFYPNGGHRPEPGCPLIRTPLSDDDFCDHHKSYEYYAESLLNENAFIGEECGTYDAFLLGFCNWNSYVVMGFRTPNTASGKVYLQTNRKSPYGRGK